MRTGNELVGDPKCWECATVVLPGKIYGPNICSSCIPKYKKRKYTYVRWSQEEIDKLFPLPIKPGEVIRPEEKGSIIRPLETTLEKGKENMKTETCRDCEVIFEIPKQRGRPAVRCQPCRDKTPTVMSFARVNATGTKENVELRLENIDGVVWVENTEPCTGCGATFMRPRKRGRPPTKCENCSATDDANKAELVTTSDEKLEELYKGDRFLLQGTPSEIPVGAEAQCPSIRSGSCGRIFTSNSACDEHKKWLPNGKYACIDPTTLGMEPRSRVRDKDKETMRIVPVWTRPTPIVEG